MQIFHLVDRVVRNTVRCLDLLEDLLPHAFLHLRVFGQFAESIGDGGDAALATGYEEDRCLSDKSVSFES